MILNSNEYPAIYSIITASINLNDFPNPVAKPLVVSENAGHYHPYAMLSAMRLDKSNVYDNLLPNWMS